MSTSRLRCSKCKKKRSRNVFSNNQLRKKNKRTCPLCISKDKQKAHAHQDAPKQAQSSRCANCGNQAKLMCSWCKLVHYCNKKCQKSHWRQHKAICNWSLDKKKAKTKKEIEIKRNEPHFIQTAPGVWHHPARPFKTTIDKYKEMAFYGCEPHHTWQSEPIITANINMNHLRTFVQHMPSSLFNKEVRSSVVSFRSGPEKMIDDESLGIIMRKSIRGWRDVPDSIVGNICAFHYGYKAFNAAYLIIALLSEHKRTNQVLSTYLRSVKSSYDDDIGFERSEELFESQRPLMVKHVKQYMDIFGGYEPQFVDLVNYMNANYYDCHVMTNHITNDMLFFRDLYVFIVGVTARGGLEGILIGVHNPEGDVWD